MCSLKTESMQSRTCFCTVWDFSKLDNFNSIINNLFNEISVCLNGGILVVSLCFPWCPPVNLNIYPVSVTMHPWKWHVNFVCSKLHKYIIAINEQDTAWFWNFHTEEVAENCRMILALKGQCEWGEWVRGACATRSYGQKCFKIFNLHFYCMIYMLLANCKYKVLFNERL